MTLMIGFIFIGVTMEVICTSIMGFIKDKDPRPKRETYLWMLPISAAVPFIYEFVQGVLPEMS